MKLPKPNIFLESICNSNAFSPLSQSVKYGALLPMAAVQYVSPSYREAIINGEVKNPCPPGTHICWGTGRHFKGYVCCNDVYEVCDHGVNGRPSCKQSQAAARMMLRQINVFPEEIVHEIGGYV
jgi:hypothetical protein